MLTSSISCNEDSEVSRASEIPIIAVVGPEFVTGSTRMIMEETGISDYAAAKALLMRYGSVRAAIALRAKAEKSSSANPGLRSRTGGFRNALQHIIRPIFEESGVRIRAFIPAPVEELVKYHRQVICKSV